MPVIATNTAANSALRYLDRNSRIQENTFNKLSSGRKIVRSSDDAAGMAISVSLQADKITLQQASRNISDMISILNTADSLAGRLTDILSRMRSLAASSMSGSLSNQERSFLDLEFTQLQEGILDIGDVEYEGISFFGSNSSFGSVNGLETQVGIAASDIISVTYNLQVDDDIDAMGESINTSSNASSALNTLNADIPVANRVRAIIGAYISRFEYRQGVVETSIENLSSSTSALVDADIALEQSNLVASEILTEASISSLITANKMKSDLLTLLQ